MPAVRLGLAGQTVSGKPVGTNKTSRRKARLGANSPLKRRKDEEKENSQTQKDIRQYFPVRGKRKTASELKKMERDGIEKAVIENREEGMEVFYCEEKGYGVKAIRPFRRGEFICEYAGDLISQKQGMERELFYDSRPGGVMYGCYMYYFQFQEKSYCLDGTIDNGRLGRLLNHSKKNPNVQTCSIGIQNRPRLIFKALRDIEVGEELCYDYGDRSRSHIDLFPWLAV